MKTSHTLPRLALSTVAIAVAAAFAPAHAQVLTPGEQVLPSASVQPANTVSLGAGFASGESRDRARWGMFNGLRDHDWNPLLNFNYFNRDSETGRWNTIEGRNLGLDNQEFGLSFRQLGDWKFNAFYSEITRHDPRTINTGVQGIGTTTPVVTLLPSIGTGTNQNLELKRKGLTLSGDKWITNQLQVELSFKNEDKDGARFFGRGFTCPSGSAPAPTCGTPLPGGIANQWALLMIPEPVSSSIRQLEGKLNFSSGPLFLSGGYYGSFYSNSFGSINPSVPATLVNGLGVPTALDAGLRGILQTPMALPPDNQAHQLSLAGVYRQSKSTSYNFKYSYTRMSQNESFTGMGLTGAPAGRSDLGAQVNRTKAQVGFSTHATEKLHVHGDLKYDNRQDKTPVARYNIEGVNTFTNGPYSPKRVDGKLEAAYRLPGDYTGVLGVFFENEDNGAFPQTVNVAGLSGLRQKLEEKGARAELRKTMSETFTGSVSYSHARREGNSPWLKPAALPATGVIEASPDCLSVGANACIYNRTAIFPFIFLDRTRDKVRLMGNWQPGERLSTTLFFDAARDSYSGPTEHGLRDTGMTMASADAAYTLSDNWKMTGYLSHGRQETNAGHSTGYDATLLDINNTAGLGVLGAVSNRLRLGADLTYQYDRLIYKQNADAGASAANVLFLNEQGGLPDVTYRVAILKLFGEYEVIKSGYVRLDFTHYRSYFDEWTYSFNGRPFFYSDNTTLSAQQNQVVNFLGLSYVYRFR